MSRIIGAIRRAVFPLLLFVLSAAQGHSQAGQEGQNHPNRRRVPVTVALVDAFPTGGQPFAILRRAGAGDVILLPRGADAATLSDAVRALVLVRSQAGDSATRSATLRTRTQARSISRRLELPWAGRVLADVQRASPRVLAGVGMARAVEIWLPRSPSRPTH